MFSLSGSLPLVSLSVSLSLPLSLSLLSDAALEASSSAVPSLALLKKNTAVLLPALRLGDTCMWCSPLCSATGGHPASVSSLAVVVKEARKRWRCAAATNALQSLSDMPSCRSVSGTPGAQTPARGEPGQPLPPAGTASGTGTAVRGTTTVASAAVGTPAVCTMRCGDDGTLLATLRLTASGTPLLPRPAVLAVLLPVLLRPSEAQTEAQRETESEPSRGVGMRLGLLSERRRPMLRCCRSCARSSAAFGRRAASRCISRRISTAASKCAWSKPSGNYT